MEFMDISLLAGSTNHNILAFEELKKLPSVLVDMDCRLIPTEENRLNLQKTIETGSAVARIRKINTNPCAESEFPKRVLFEMTSCCNVLCKMCPRNNLHRPTMHMDKESYLKMLAEINQYGVEGLWLYHLGESLMHPDFREIVGSLSSFDNLGYIWLSTNGHLMNQSNIDFILSSKIDYINFSLHAVTEEIYKTVVPHGDFKKVSANYYNLIKTKKRRGITPYIHLQMIEQEITKNEIEEFIRQHYKEVEIVSVNMLEYVNMPNNQFGYQQRKRKPKGHCARVRSKDCFIFSNGAVTFCDAAYDCSPERFSEHYLGNIYNSSLYAIWNGEKRKKMEDLESKGLLHQVSLCAECTDYDLG